MNDSNKEINIALIGNPNVGKSSIFNLLTGLHQHTGNWAGKTVDHTEGLFESEKFIYRLTDLPGTYSIDSETAEEKIACDVIDSSDFDIIAVICDATCLQRNLLLVLKTQDKSDRVLMILNMIDQAQKRGIEIDVRALEKELGIKCIPVCAKDKSCKKQIVEQLDKTALQICTNDKEHRQQTTKRTASEYIKEANSIYSKTVTAKEPYSKRDLLIDKIVTGKAFAFPVMFVFMLLLFWITIAGANYPSTLLSIGFDRLGIKLNAILSYINTPDFLRLVIIDGIYKVVGWVVAVMLPPMAIFFPLFTLLEDLGFLPRIAYNLDRPFRCCGSCGKQALTMCMGIGCNAVGVTGARIFGSERERIVAVITNSFIPCNGRFPAIISIITIFFISSQSGHTGSFECAFFLCLFILLAIAITMLSTKLISGLIRANEHITYTLELPPYRIPQISKTIIRSIYERTSLILTRAVLVAAPAGFILYIVSNITINGASVLSVLSGLLSPIGEFVGLDGAILLAFLFGMPANEIVIPVLLMIYLKSNSIAEYSDIDQLNNILRENGWTALTAVNFIIFSLFHFPCSTTLITIYKETRSIKWTVISVILPLLIGFLLCFVNKQLFTLIT